MRWKWSWWMVPSRQVAGMPKSSWPRVRAIQEEMAQLPVLDERSPEEIIGYNGRGHFD